MTQNDNQPTNWQAWAQMAILLGLGIYFVVLIISGNLANYINLRFQWLSYVGAGIFFMLGIWSAYQFFRGGSHDQVIADSEFDHVPLNWVTIAIVAIPLAFAALVPSRPLDASAIQGGISFNPVGVSSPARFNLEPEERNVLDWLREFARVGNPASLNGQNVNVIGFVYREGDMYPDQFMLARFTMSCCVADAFAVGLPVVYEGEVQEGAWVRIEGALQAEQFQDEFMPVIIPTQVEPVDEPDNPYLYS